MQAGMKLYLRAGKHGQRRNCSLVGRYGAAAHRVSFCSILLSLFRLGGAISFRQGAGSVVNVTRMHAAASRDTPQIDRRPGVHGQPTLVKFGIYVKKVYSVDPVDRSFTADIIFTYMWKDEESAARLLKNGLSELQLSDEKARSSLWLPDMTVSNRAAKMEVISSTCIVQSDGDIIQVIRSVVTILNKFNMEQFPFDTQELTVELASASYMLSEVVLEPMGSDPTVGSQGARSNKNDDSSIADRLFPPRIFGRGGKEKESKRDGSSTGSVEDAVAHEAPNENLDVDSTNDTNGTGFVNYAAALAGKRDLYGVAPGIFEDKEYGLVDVNMESYETEDSVLRKSRGKLSFFLQHRPFSFLISSFMPVLLLQVVATASFFFPMAAQFAMPRTATILVSQLAAISFSVRIATAHPSDNRLSWIEIFISEVQLQMFLVMCLNMCCEHMAHNLKASLRASRTNEECKLVVLACTLVSNTMLFLTPAVQISEGTLSSLILTTITLGYGSLFGRIVWLIRKEVDHTKATTGAAAEIPAVTPRRAPVV